MTDLAGRLSAAVAERYAIERELGQGGMATVFLAHDVRHNRKVALKVLRPELAAMIGAERFLKEIEVTANLQHPHILPLHDSGEADGFLYYVMPYVEGETLRTLLTREKQLGIDRAVEIARSVASALDYAHRQGVIHRDIKPENVLLLDGQAMVADFGIALAVSQAGGSRLTETGLSLGTPHYMSPEQAMGDRVLDARSDVYSLGAMLYEMLAGDPPYTGGTAQAIVAKVITEKPAPLSVARDTVPPNVVAAVHQALAKLPADRFASAAEFAAALVTPGFTAATAAAMAGLPSPSGRAGGIGRWRDNLPAIAAIAILAVAAGWGWLRPTPGAPVSRFTVSLESGSLDGGLAISPDGSLLVIGGVDSAGKRGLYLRPLDQLEPRRLTSTEDGLLPKFSPDGREISFFKLSGTLWRASIQGSPPVLLADSAQVAGQGWGDDGNVYFIRNDGALARVPAGGGSVEVLLVPDSNLGASQLLEPAPLPGGKGVLVTAIGSSGPVLIALDLKTREHRVVVEGFSGRYAEPGRLVYATSNGTLFQAPFDRSAMRLTGPAKPVAGGLAVILGAWVDIGVSKSGSLAYMEAGGGQADGNLFVKVSRDGGERVLPIPAAPYQAFGLSPDGKRVAAEVVEGSQDGGSIATFGMGDSIVTRLTFQGVNRYPTWTADGRRVAFSQLNGGERDLVWKPADGSGIEEPLLKRPGSQFEVEFSRDGRWMVYRDGDATGALETLSLRYRRMGADGEDSVFYDSPRGDYTPVLSPDGRWLAYTSMESGKEQVYVRPFPPQTTGAVWQVSAEDGIEPVWSRSGGELFYREHGWLMAAEVKAGTSFAVVARRRLFQAGRYLSNSYHSRYAVLPGDREFLMVRPANQGSQRAVVVLNWARELPPK